VVLVVEDNAELRHVLKEALGSEGYHVLTTRDEVEALEILRETQVDLLISDLTDQPEPALETVRREFPDLPVVALSKTASNDPAFFLGAWESQRGFRTLPKPFRLGELLAVSREVLGAGPEAEPLL
jgi:CheY-like chemotaxis protein